MPDRGSLHSGLPRVPSIFCPTPAAQAVVRQLPPLVVLRAPRGFGKTSTVAYWLRSGALDDRTALWLTLPEPTTPAELWQTMHDALVEASLAVVEAEPDRMAVDRALRRLSRRLVLIVDGLHNVTDTSVDADLVELAQAHELVHLIVISRVESPILRLGPATVDTTVLGVRDLLLTNAEAALLADRLGLDAREDEIERLVADHAGWPALVRAALLDTRRAPDGRLVTDPTGVARYVSLVLADPEHAAWAPVVTALAVPQPVRQDDLASLFDDAETRAAAETVIAQSFTMVHADGVAFYPEGLRVALLEHLRTEDPQGYRDLNARLSRRRRRQQRPVEALRYAMRAEAWPLVLAILEENWAQLLRRHTEEVAAAVQALPRDLVASSPRLVVAQDYVLDSDVRAQAEASLRAGLLTPGGRLPVRTLTTTQRLALRFDGTPTFGAEELLLGRLDSSMASQQSGHAPHVQRAVPELLTQWALSMLYDNDGVGAAYAFVVAEQEAERLDDRAAAREAASGAALAMALLGHLRAAEVWSAHAARFAVPPSALEEVAAPLTHALVAGQRLEEVEWAEPTRDGSEHGLAPLVALSRVAGAFVDVLHGRLERTRVALQRHAGDHDGDQEEVVRASVAALQVDLALAEGRIDRAGALLVGANDAGAWSVASRARHAFYVGAYAEALRLTEDAASYAGTRPRAGLELLLIHACADWRAGRRDSAVDHLASAVGIAGDTGVLIPFLTVPRADLEAIAPPGSWSRDFLEQPPLAGTDTVFPEPLRAGELSVAELRVLRELRAGVPLAHIGRRLYLSESTVKTHVRRIYRKLGVSDRAHALDRARELSLLDD